MAFTEQKRFDHAVADAYSRILNGMEDLESRIRKSLGKSSSRLYISNINAKTLKTNTYYCLTISTKHIQLHRQIGRETYRQTFDLARGGLYTNGRADTLSKIAPFFQLVKTIFRDLRHGKAKLYEKKVGVNA